MERIIYSLAFDITRRCNLNCDFCYKGKSQNDDITKEVIDKTLDNIKEERIEILSILGGEPTLNIPMIEYLIDGIINRGIYVYSISMFTNGLICDESILPVLTKAREYLENVIAEKNDRIHKFITMKKNYNPRVRITISTAHHRNENAIEKAKQFYEQLASPFFLVYVQEQFDEQEVRIILNGNAIENYKTILSKNTTYKQINFENSDEYYFIEYLSTIDAAEMQRCILVTTNGNVVCNSTKSYSYIDSKPVFNICRNNNGLWEEIDAWCWKHPIGGNARMMRNYKDAMLFLSENMGTSFSNYDKNLIRITNNIIDELEIFCLSAHNEYPFLNFGDIERIAAARYIKINKTIMSKRDLLFYIWRVTDFQSYDLLEEMYVSDEWENTFIGKIERNTNYCLYASIVHSINNILNT